MFTISKDVSCVLFHETGVTPCSLVRKEKGRNSAQNECFSLDWSFGKQALENIVFVLLPTFLSKAA